MATYCNATTDIQRIFPRIDEYKVEKPLKGWVVHSGSVYKLADVGYGTGLYENGTPMTAAASIATISAGKYYYDSTNDIIYAQSTTGTVVDGVNSYRWCDTWSTVKTWAITEASARVEGLLDSKFPIPIPENPFGSSTAKYDAPVVNATAYLAASLLVGRKEPPQFDVNGVAVNFAAQLYTAGKSIIDQYNEGKLRFSWELTAEEIGGYNIIPTSGNTSVGMFQLRGVFTGEDDELWMLKISTGGALGTAEYQLSTDNGTTYETAVDTSATWTELADDVYIRFFGRGGGASSFVLNDTWQIVVSASTNNPTRGRIGSISLVG